MKFENENEFGECPYCKGTEDKHGMRKGMLMVLQDWVSLHDKESLLHCCDCDRLYIVKYKLVKIVELVEKEIKAWDM